MEHFTQMMMNLAIHTTVVPLLMAVSHLTKFMTKSHRIICKRKKNRKISTERKQKKRKDRTNA